MLTQMCNIKKGNPTDIRSRTGRSTCAERLITVTVSRDILIPLQLCTLQMHVYI